MIKGYYEPYGLGIRLPFYDIRECKLENYNPMAHTLMLKQNYAAHNVQIFVDVVGGREWINVPKSEIDEVIP